MTQKHIAEAAAEKIAAWFEQYFHSLEVFRAQAMPVLATAFADPEALAIVTPAMSAQLDRPVADFFSAQPAADGTGIIFALEQLDPNHRTLEWWQRDGDGQVRTTFDLNPNSTAFYDYDKLVWYRGAFIEGHRTVAGPYIDYLGVDFYACTFATPAVVHGRKIGIVASDMPMHALERELLPVLAPLQQGAAVLGPQQQVLVGTSGQIATGVLVSLLPEGFTTCDIPVPGLGLTLLYHG